MEKGESINTNILFKYLDKNSKDIIEEYVLNSCKERYIEFKTKEDIQKNFCDLVNEFTSKLSNDELLDIRTYTGYNFKKINAILRNKWTYEENGILNDNIRKEYLNLANRIDNILNKFPSFKYNFVTYRGATLSSFKKYGINSLNDLACLKNKYMYEEGFSSTSILESSCYFKKKLDTGKNYNVEIKYLITPEYNEGALLIDNDLTYSLNQNEYLINKSSLSKVVDVKINEEDDSAILTVVLIPRNRWDLQKIENNVKLK